MSHASAIPPGGRLGTPRRGWNSPVNRASETEDLHQRAPVQQDDLDGPDPYAGEAKWPAWIVTVAVILFCGAFWAGVSYVGSLLFG